MTPPSSTHGYDLSLMPWRMPLSSGSEGRSTHWPFTSYFHPWYGQRSPHSSLRPNHSDTPRWFGRSAEHTSELQSQSNLVCRLLLAKITATIMIAEGAA